ncbi:DAK2 domain-containing protein [Candidatus Contubernalis alkaliaceticus]|uniref:DAK2 domain-containing protein n=1 Tax=Candidatus Contubernalis alkaliaceticus TaxID=338645 RepID=UPI001F4C133D|nr:DAK2 domain-containing protein [Candidatus Contubernalis alkalaceticus]UNC92768.1 DAK2 domain-containing protein [Candidatus Contubernalis alkalaceticus]
MGIQVLEGINLKKMFLGGPILLNQKKQFIDSLNVFPVPDGDTGTNMSLTLNFAVQQLEQLEDNSVGKVVETIATGSLMGARGNSGVIMSQLFRGFSRGVGEKKDITPEEFSRALQEGVKTAYKAVMKPVEGTMLTVAREAADAALRKAEMCGDFIPVMEDFLRQARQTLKKTPQMLPVLKQAGVVDAGGEGLCAIYEGFLKALQGYDFDSEVIAEEKTEIEVLQVLKNEEIIFQYCTELLVKGSNLQSEELQEKLMDLGDSLLVVGEGEILKVHVHTNNPGRVLDICIGFGELSQIKIDNMKEQKQEFVQEETNLSQDNDKLNNYYPNINTEREAVGGIQIIAVSPGDGISEIFKSMGPTLIIEGGQTMNPSTEDFLQAIDKSKAEQLIILPNNKNIILAAEQSSKLSTKEVVVVPSKTIPQGITALMAFDSIEKDIDKNVYTMKESLSQVKTGQVTYAVRDSTYEGKAIKNGSVIGLEENTLKIVGQNTEEVVISLIQELFQDGDEIITLYYGKGVTKEEVEQLCQKLQNLFPQSEVEYYLGGQPLYYYFISVE